MPVRNTRLGLTALTLAAAFCSTLSLSRVQGEEKLRPLKHDTIRNGEVYRHGNTVVVHVAPNVKSGEVTIPRFCGRLRTVAPSPSAGYSSVNVHPEPDYWMIRWANVPAPPEKVTLTFDQPPVLLSELEPATAAGDGSIMLHAWQASTSGEKLRFEPQTFKNTVGYWVGANDKATWTLKVDDTGEFNVGILQGCGKGQGGSQAAVRLRQGEQSVSEFEFEVAETGHFQNFQWRNIGLLAVTEPGIYTLQIMPKQIKKNALMDVRAVHLVKLPAPKKK